MRDLNILKEAIPFTFRNEGILKSVFVHASYLNEKEGRGLFSNERLEFLGDAVLESVISHILFERFPEMNEGELTKFRSRLVNREVLASIARELNLGDYLLLGKGERLSGGAENVSILADALEALIAAAYLDRKPDGVEGGGYGDVFAFISTLFSCRIDASLEERTHFDHKPALQELCQSRLKEEPVYRVTSEEGPPHERIFEIEVSVGDRVLGSGVASRKKTAEQLAASAALDLLKEESEQIADSEGGEPGEESK